MCNQIQFVKTEAKITATITAEITAEATAKLQQNYGKRQARTFGKAQGTT